MFFWCEFRTQRKEETTILFTELNLSDECLKAVEQIGYVEPTLIQEKAIPALLDGRDVLGKSNTGTGKTAAFVIPAVEMIETNKKHVQVLVLSPTRELAMQTHDEVTKIAQFKRGINSAIVVGGQSMTNQIKDLKSANIVIGTPGRVMDHLRRGTLKLEEISLVVLDEADEMLNMGFYEDINTILETAPEERQTALFSATMPRAIQNIADEFLVEPVNIETSNGQKTLDAIRQAYYLAPRGKKVDVLKLVISEYQDSSMIIFCNTKRMVDALVDELAQDGYRAEGLHGDMSQSMRSKVMDAFKKGRCKMLLATDVAARGIDVYDLDLVINFDLPQDNEYYIHRIGRTGRAGRSGLALTIIGGSSQERTLRDIQRYLKCNIEKLNIPSTEKIKSRREMDFAQKISEQIDASADDQWSRTYDNLVMQGYDSEQIARTLMNMLAEKENLNVTPIDVVETKKRNKQNLSDNADTLNVRLSLGRLDSMAPNFIIAALTEVRGVDSSHIGKIDILKSCTIIRMQEEAANILISKGVIKIRNIKAEITRANDRDQQRNMDSDGSARRGERGRGGDRGRSSKSRGERNDRGRARYSKSGSEREQRGRGGDRAYSSKSRGERNDRNRYRSKSS